MGRLGRLLAHAAELGVEVRWGRTSTGRWAEYRHARRLIFLAWGLAEWQTECALAHELGHAAHGDTCSTPANERRANAYAARLLICPADYALAEQVHGPHVGALARELGVTPTIIQAWRANEEQDRATIRPAV